MLQQARHAHAYAQLACKWQDRIAISHPSGSTGKPSGLFRCTAGPDRHLARNISPRTSRWRNRRLAGWRRSCACPTWQLLEQVRRCSAERVLVTPQTVALHPKGLVQVFNCMSQFQPVATGPGIARYRRLTLRAFWPGGVLPRFPPPDGFALPFAPLWCPSCRLFTHDVIP